MDVVSVAYESPPAPVQAPAPQPQVVTEAPAVELKKHEAAIQTEKIQAEKASPAPSMEMIEKALEQINKSIAPFSRHMDISIHSKLKRIMVKVMDTQKNEVIREIPPEKVLDAFAKSLELAGILLDKKR